MKFYVNPYSFDVSLFRCVKASLLPHAGSSSSAWSLCTRPSSSLSKPSFGEHFPLAVPRAALASKTLQATIWAVAPDVEEECLGSAQVSLADFDCGAASVRWYNVLSFRFMQQPEEQSKQQQQQQQRQKTTARQRLLLASPKQQQSRLAAAAAAATAESGSRQGTLKEESSDESTAISSQASTLTRDNGGSAGLSPAALAIAARLAEGEEAVEESGDEDEEDEDDEDDDVIIPTLPEVLESFDAIQAAANKADLVSAH